MNQVIVYLQDNGVVAVVYPSPDTLAQHDIEAIAVKDVPAGKPFKILPATSLPGDSSQRNAWTIDPALLNDGIGGESNEFQEAA